MVTPPPHDRPRPSKHRSHRRVRAFSGVSSLSPPNVSVKNHPTTETKKPLVFCFFVFLVLWFFGFLFFWFFGFLFFCFFGCLVLLWRRLYFKKHQNPKKQRTKKPKNKKNKKPTNQRTKKPKNQKAKTPKNQNCSSILRGALVFWFRSLGGSSRTRSEGSNSIPRKKQIDTYTNTKPTLIPR